MVAMLGRDAFVTEFASVEGEAVDHVVAADDEASEEAVFEIGGARDQIAIARIERMIGVVAVLRVRREESLVRNGERELLELLGERPREIEVPAVREFIPPVTPPLILIEDFVRFILRVDGNHRLPRQIRFAVVEAEIVAMQETALHPARRTVLRRRDEFFPAHEDR